MSEVPTPLSDERPARPELMVDDARARFNTWVLTAAQGLYSIASINMFSTAALAGYLLAPSPRWATLPITTYIIGTALLTWPASMIMLRVGRRNGFLMGAFMGLLAAVGAVYAIFERDFALFCAATMLQGGYQAFAQYYRFAAADMASPSFRPKAVSWVLTGSIAGAVLGPIVVMNTRELFAPVSFAGNFAAAGVFTMVALIVLTLVSIPSPREVEGGTASAAPGRPLAELVRSPRLLTAILTGMMAYGMMNLLMTATPLAMVGCGLSVDQSAWVIQWHVLAMYVPSFFTGALIARHGAERIIAMGLLLNALAALVNLSGLRMENFGFGLVLLGLGWNFAFIGATSMVSEITHADERARVQGLNDFAVFATVALTSFTAGQLLDASGWSAVNYALFPMLALAAAGLAWHVTRVKRARGQS